MKSLEDAEQFVYVSHVEADTIIVDEMRFLQTLQSFKFARNLTMGIGGRFPVGSWVPHSLRPWTKWPGYAARLAVMSEIAAAPRSPSTIV